jgi:hypothetical protein
MSRLLCDACGATPSADDYLVDSDCPACDEGVLVDPDEDFDDDDHDYDEAA